MQLPVRPTIGKHTLNSFYLGVLAGVGSVCYNLWESENFTLAVVFSLLITGAGYCGSHLAFDVQNEDTV